MEMTYLLLNSLYDSLFVHSMSRWSMAKLMSLSIMWSCVIIMYPHKDKKLAIDAILESKVLVFAFISLIASSILLIFPPVYTKWLFGIIIAGSLGRTLWGDKAEESKDFVLFKNIMVLGFWITVAHAALN